MCQRDHSVGAGTLPVVFVFVWQLEGARERCICDVNMSTASLQGDIWSWRKSPRW